MRPTQIAEALNLSVTKKRPVFVWGPPGVGKSDVAQQVADQRGMELRDVRLNLMDPTDIKGFPVPNVEHGHMEWLPADFLPPATIRKDVKITAKKTESQIVMNDSQGILFLDELNQAPPAVQAASYQLLLGRKVGNYKLPDGWAIMAAGNREGDRANAQRMPSALANRLIHLDYEVNVDDWCAWALQQGDRVPVELLAFIRFKPDLLHNHKPNERAFPTPRSWVTAADIAGEGLSASTEFEMINGTVGPGASGEYAAFLQVYRDLPSVDSIKLNPEKVAISEQPSVRFAISAALAAATTKDTFERFMIYMERMEPEWVVTYVRDAQARSSANPDKKGHIDGTKAFINFCLKHSVHLT